MRILFLTSVDHPWVIMEAESLSKLFKVDYVLTNYVSINDVSHLKKALVALLKNLPIVCIALIRLHIPPIPFRLFISQLLIAGLLIDNRRLSTQRYNIIYANWLFPAGFVGLILSKVLHTKIVSVIHGYDIQFVTGVKGYGILDLKRIVAKYVLRRCNVVTAYDRIYEELAVSLAGASYRNKIVYVPPGIPDIEPSPNNKDQLPAELKNRADILHRRNVVLYSPQLKPLYGIIDFMKAIPLIVAQLDDCLFIITGEGELKSEAMRFIEERKLVDKVVFTGRVSHNTMTTLYKLSTVVCDLCYAGQGTTTFEAFRSGKPVIGIATAKRYIEHGKNGFLVRRGDYENLASYILRISCDHKLMEKMSKNARESFERNFNIVTRITELTKIFNALACREPH